MTVNYKQRQPKSGERVRGVKGGRGETENSRHIHQKEWKKRELIHFCENGELKEQALRRFPIENGN